MPSSTSCGPGWSAWRPGRDSHWSGSAGPARPRSRRDFSMRSPGPICRHRPDRLFVWSFYLEPDVGVFLDQAYRYFAERDVPCRTCQGRTDLLHLLREALLYGGRNLLVLDGLERVQREEGQHAGRLGQIETPAPRPPAPDRRGCRPDGRTGHQPVPSDGPRAAARSGLPSPGRQGAHARRRPWTCFAATAYRATRRPWHGSSSRTELTH